MEQLRNAYEKLGLTETASIDEVENRYFLFMRREKTRQNKSNSEQAVTTAFEAFSEVTAAYQLIKEHHLAQKLEADYPEEQAKSPARRKFEYFWEYYKIHTIFMIIGIVIVAAVMQSIIQNQREKAIEAAKPPIDISISIFGNYSFNNINPDLSSLDTAILQMMTGWKRVKINFVYSPLEAKDSFDVAFQQKSVLALVTEKPNLYISDNENFKKLAYQGLYLPLSDYEPEFRKMLPAQRLIYSEIEDSPNRKLYGIDITGSSVFHGLIISHEPKIIAIRADAPQSDKAIALILKIASQLKN